MRRKFHSQLLRGGTKSQKQDSSPSRPENGLSTTAGPSEPSWGLSEGRDCVLGSPAPGAGGGVRLQTARVRDPVLGPFQRAQRRGGHGVPEKGQRSKVAEGAATQPSLGEQLYAAGSLPCLLSSGQGQSQSSQGPTWPSSDPCLLLRGSQSLTRGGGLPTPISGSLPARPPGWSSALSWGTGGRSEAHLKCR